MTSTITLPGVLSSFTSELVATPIEMSVSSPSPGDTPVVIPNSENDFGGFPTSNQKFLGEPNGIPVVIPNPENKPVGGLPVTNPNPDLVVGGLPITPPTQELVPGGFPVPHKDTGLVPGGVAIDRTTSVIVPGSTPETIPPELVGIDGQYLGDKGAVINGLSPRVVSPGGVPVVIR